MSESKVDPNQGRVAIVTGANTGIGFHTAKSLAQKGYRVVLACRNEGKGLDACQRIRRDLPEHKIHVEYMCLDLSRFASVRQFVEAFNQKYGKLHVLVNNAGINGGYDKPTEDGLNAIFQVNYLAQVYLTLLLLPTLKSSAPARIVNVASVMHRFGSLPKDLSPAALSPVIHTAKRKEGGAVYPLTKLMLMFFTKKMQMMHAKDGVASVAVNPGAVNSDIWRTTHPAIMPAWKKFMGLIFLTPEQGSATSLVAAEMKAPEEDDLVYLSPYPTSRCCPLLLDCVGPFAGANRAQPNPILRREDVMEGVWRVTHELIEQAKHRTAPQTAESS